MNCEGVFIGMTYWAILLTMLLFVPVLKSLWTVSFVIVDMTAS
jgi:hypothetical protein